MVFSFDFLSHSALISEVARAGGESVPIGNGGLLFVHDTAFMKVLGAEIDWNEEEECVLFRDREGNLMDPNH